MIRKSKKDAKKTLNALRRAGRKIAREAGFKPGERFFFGKKSPKQGGAMAKQRKSKAHHGIEGGAGGRCGGEFGGKKGKRGRSVRVRHVLMGAGEGGGLGGIGKILLNALVAGGGAVVGSTIATKVPLPVKFKPAVPLGIAIILALMGKKVPFANILALGNAAAAGLGFAKQLMPKLPLLAGVDSIPALEESERQAILAYHGIGEAEITGEAEMTGEEPGANFRRLPGQR